MHSATKQWHKVARANEAALTPGSDTDQLRRNMNKAVNSSVTKTGHISGMSCNERQRRKSMTQTVIFLTQSVAHPFEKENQKAVECKYE